MCTREDGLAYILGAPFFDGVMSYNSLTIQLFKIQINKSGFWMVSQMIKMTIQNTDEIVQIF